MRKLTFILLGLLSMIAATAKAADEHFIYAVYTSGVAFIDGNPFVENTSLPITFPVTVSAPDSASTTLLLPNNTGFYLLNGQIVLTKMERNMLDGTTNVLWATVDSKTFAFCSSDQSQPGEHTTNIDYNSVRLLTSGQATYAVIDSKLTVTRGDVRVLSNNGSVLCRVQEGETVTLGVLFIPIQSSSDKSVTEAVLEATINACTANVVVPSAQAEAVSAPINHFPVQPINPDIVSPSS